MYYIQKYFVFIYTKESYILDQILSDGILGSHLAQGQFFLVYCPSNFCSIPQTKKKSTHSLSPVEMSSKGVVPPLLRVTGLEGWNQVSEVSLKPWPLCKMREGGMESQATTRFTITNFLIHKWKLRISSTLSDKMFLHWRNLLVKKVHCIVKIVMARKVIS